MAGVNGHWERFALALLSLLIVLLGWIAREERADVRQQLTRLTLTQHEVLRRVTLLEYRLGTAWSRKWGAYPELR